MHVSLFLSFVDIFYLLLLLLLFLKQYVVYHEGKNENCRDSHGIVKVRVPYQR